MSTERIYGLVIKKMNFDDTDEIVSLLCHDEILNFISKGTRKLKSKNRMSLQLGNIVEADIFRARLTNKLSKLKTSNLVKQPNLLLSDSAEVILDIVNKLRFIDNPKSNLFDSILSSWDKFGEEYNHQIKTYILFNTLDSFGLKPNLKKCVICNRKDRIIELDFKSGGYLCALHNRYETELSILKAADKIQKSFNIYKDVDPYSNKVLYEMIYEYLKENTFLK